MNGTRFLYNSINENVCFLREPVLKSLLHNSKCFEFDLTTNWIGLVFFSVKAFQESKYCLMMSFNLYLIYISPVDF